MRRIFFPFISILMISCKKEIKNKIPEKKIIKKATPVLVEKKLKNTPIKEFVEFTKHLEEIGWFSDSLRLKSKNLYPPLKDGKLKLFSGRPFYKIDFNKSDIKRAHDIRPYNGRFTDSLNIDIPKKVNCIWGYFYRKEKIRSTIEDGVIEQWGFDNEIDAQKAITEIKGYGVFGFFNTSPYYHLHKNYVFIFHTRAMGFSYGQEKIYEDFKVFLKNGKH